MCHASRRGVRRCLGGKTSAAGGVTSASIVSVCAGCVCVCEAIVGGWLGGGGAVFLDCCVCRALFETGPRGPELKPYLRGFGTDGVPLFRDVFINRRWGE